MGETEKLSKRERRQVRMLMSVYEDLRGKDWKLISTELVKRLNTEYPQKFSDFRITHLECMRLYKKWHNKPEAWRRKKKEDKDETNENEEKRRTPNAFRQPIQQKSLKTGGDETSPNREKLIGEGKGKRKVSPSTESSKKKNGLKRGLMSLYPHRLRIDKVDKTTGVTSKVEEKITYANSKGERVSLGAQPSETLVKQVYKNLGSPSKKLKSGTKTDNSDTGTVRYGGSDTESETEVAGYQTVDSPQIRRKTQTEKAEKPQPIGTDNNVKPTGFVDLTRDGDSDPGSKSTNNVMKHSDTLEHKQSKTFKTAAAENTESVSRETAHANARKLLKGITLPVKLDVFKLMKLGDVIPRCYHNEGCIFPIGYTVERDFASVESPLKIVSYKLEIIERYLLDGAMRLIFRVSHPDNGNVYEAYSADDVVRKLKTALNLSPGIYTTDGLEFFGISVPSIAKLIEGLPGALGCSQYVFKAQQSGNISETEVKTYSNDSPVTIETESFAPSPCDCKNPFCLRIRTSCPVGVVCIPKNAICPDIKKRTVETISQTTVQERHMKWKEYTFAVHHFNQCSFVFDDYRWQLDYDKIQVYPWPVKTYLFDGFSGRIVWDLNSYYTNQLRECKLRERSAVLKNNKMITKKLRELPRASRKPTAFKEAMRKQRKVVEENINKAISKTFSTMEAKVKSLLDFQISDEVLESASHANTPSSPFLSKALPAL